MSTLDKIADTNDPGQTPTLPDAAPRSDRPRCGGRENNFLADRHVSFI